MNVVVERRPVRRRTWSGSRQTWQLRIPDLGAGAATGLGIVGLVALAALAAPLIAPAGPLAYSAQPLAPPSPAHWLGANDVGQDVLAQLLYGARVSLLVGLAAATLSTAIAWGLGLLSGLSRNCDGLVGGLSDLMLAMPLLPLVILVAAYLGASLPVVVVTLGLVSWGPFARIIRGEVQGEMRKPYIEAARAAGSTPVRILLRHVAPATVPTAVAKFVMTVQYAVVAQASLGFLGLGDPSVVSWGDMVHRAALSPLIFLGDSWIWLLAPPALAIGILVVGFALVGWSFEERTLPGVRRAAYPFPIWTSRSTS
jgi:ABC-type dipeptide/oligopeptide/nickel transport system permease subunit